MSTLFLSLTILVYLWAQGSVAVYKDCPDPDDTYPCYCEEEDGITTLHCTHLTQSKQIKEGLSKLTDYEISSVSIWMYDVEQIKSDAFRGPAIKEIMFTHSTANLENPPFRGQEKHLNRLGFLSCFDEEDPLGTFSLGHLENLKDLGFEKNNIKVLKNGWITSAGPNLRTVSFDNCKIEQLEDKVFSQLKALTTIFFMDNKITSLKRSIFPMPADDLRSLNFNGNNIDTLSDDIFEDMPSLRSVNFEDNNLKKLSESVWSSKIEDLSRLYLEENPIQCDKDLKWISKKTLPKTLTGTCSTPAILKNKELRHLVPADFH